MTKLKEIKTDFGSVLAVGQTEEPKKETITFEQVQLVVYTFIGTEIVNIIINLIVDAIG